VPPLKPTQKQQLGAELRSGRAPIWNDRAPVTDFKNHRFYAI